MEQTIKKQFIAVRAVIIKDEKVLIIRQSEQYAGSGGEYDFPGGKVEMGESVTDALLREVQEEVGIKVKIGKPFFVDEWRPTVKGEQVQIIGIFFLCEPIDMNIVLSPDHDHYEWMPIKEYLNFKLLKQKRSAVEALLKIRG